MPTFFRMNDSYKPDVTVPKFESLNWTERYRDAGDFQLIVENDLSVLGLLPRGCLVSHTDTLEVMMVENHEITRDKNKKLQVTISGRGFETFAENRLALGTNTPLKYQDPDYPDDPTKLLENITVLSMTSSAAAVALLKAGLEPGTASAEDAIPNLAISAVMRATDAAMEHVIPRGNAYEAVIPLLNLNDAGVRMERPIGADTSMDMIVNDGVDRRDAVTFYAHYADLDDANYFWSTVPRKDYVGVAGETYYRLHRDRNLTSDLTGLNRRVMYLPSDDLKGDFSPPAASDQVASKGQTALDANKETALLAAKIAKQARPKFKVHYDVGDLVTVFAEFTISQSMRVVEHILTVDKKGAVGYPSLKTI